MGHSTQANGAFAAAMEDVLASIDDRALLIACWSRFRFLVLAAGWKPVIQRVGLIEK
jgi:hypothetical protein